MVMSINRSSTSYLFVCCEIVFVAGSQKTSVESRGLANRLVDFLRENVTIGKEIECGWVRSRIRSQGKRH